MISNVLYKVDFMTRLQQQQTTLPLHLHFQKLKLHLGKKSKNEYFVESTDGTSRAW